MHVLIIEDEYRIANRIKRMLKEILSDELLEIHQVEDVEEGIDYLNTNAIDLLLLDLNLNGEDGFEVLSEIGAGDFHVIIVSAYKEKAVTAFEYGILDFVPKPFTEKRLAQALARIKGRNLNTPTPMRYLSVLKKGRYLLLDINEILFFQGANVYSEVHMNDGRKEIHNKSLEKLERILPPRFKRIHKSYIVDWSKVKALESAPGSKYSLILKNGKILPVGRTRYKNLKTENL